MNVDADERRARSVGGRRVKKYSVSMPEDLAEEIRAKVGPGEFSSYVAMAVRHQAERDGLRAIIEAYEAESGPVPEDLVARAEETFRQAAVKEAEWQANRREQGL